MGPLDRYICDLLYDHDCVIVPPFGGFLASYAGAKIHPAQHTISPPSRKVAFNIFLKQNDGLLAQHIASSEHISYSEALRKIDSEASFWYRRLEEGKKLLIDGVGSLFYDAEHNVQFEPLISSNFLKDSFGLGTLQYLPVLREVPLQKTRSEIRPSIKPVPGKAFTAKRASRGIGAAIIAGAVLWLGFNIYFVLNSNKNDTVSLLLPQVKKETPVQQQTDDGLKSNIESTASVISIPETSRRELNPLNERTEPAIPPVENILKERAPAPSQPQEEKKYFIIAGAFRISSNADGLVKSLREQGFHAAHIVPAHHKLTLVCYDGFSTASEAESILDTIKEGKKEGWIFSN